MSGERGKEVGLGVTYDWRDGVRGREGVVIASESESSV